MELAKVFEVIGEAPYLPCKVVWDVMVFVDGSYFYAFIVNISVKSLCSLINVFYQRTVRQVHLSHVE